MPYTSQDIREAGRQANALLREIGEVRRKRGRKQDALDARMQKFKDQYGPEIEQLKQQEESLIEQLTQLVLPRFALLAKKGAPRTIRLRSGEIQLRRSSQDSLLVEDGQKEPEIIQRIKKRGGLRRFTRLSKRTLDKEALKKDPAFVAKIKGLSIGRKTSLIIRPARAQGQEIERELDPLSVPVAIDEN